MGLLDELRQKAASIAGQQEDEAQRLARSAESVDKALRDGFAFFQELAGYLNVIKPANKRSYAIPRLGTIEGLHQSEFFADYRTAPVLDKVRLDHFYLRYTSSADRVIQRNLDFIGAERLRNALWESHVEFTHKESRDEQHRLLSGSFDVPCRIRSELVFKGDYSMGLMHVTCRNVNWLGREEFTHLAEEVDVRLFEEYVKFVFGEPSTILQQGY